MHVRFVRTYAERLCLRYIWIDGGRHSIGNSVIAAAFEILSFNDVMKTVVNIRKFTEQRFRHIL